MVERGKGEGERGKGKGEGERGKGNGKNCFITLVSILSL